MKIILLAAGRSQRLQPIADKNLLAFLGKPLIQIQVEKLKTAEFEDIIIVGNKENLPQFAELNLDVRFVEQVDLETGMKGAVCACENLLQPQEDILIVSTNDLFEDQLYEDLKTQINQAGSDLGGIIVAKEVKTYFPGGYLEIDNKQQIKRIVEKPGAGNEPSSIVNLVVHYHKNGLNLIRELKTVQSEQDDLYECALDNLFQKTNYQALTYRGQWQAIKFPWHVLEVSQSFLKNIKEQSIHPSAQIAETARMHGPVIIEEGVKVFDHSAIVGPCYIGKNCVIANNTLVRESIVNKNSVIGYATEVARSFLGENVWTHHNYLGDSVIDDNVSFGAGTITGNFRLDRQKIGMQIKDQKVNSGHDKLGAIIGRNTKVGINTSIMPGKKIGKNCVVGPQANVYKDIPDNCQVFCPMELEIKEI